MAAPGKVPSPTAEGCFAWMPAEGCSPSPAFGRMLAEGEKEFLARTGYPPKPYPPVIVILHPDFDNTPSLPCLKVDALEGGSPRIRVDLRKGNPEDSDREILATALMLREYYGDNTPKPGSLIPRFPDWVSRGVGFLCFPPEEAVLIHSSYLKGEAPPALEDFLIQITPEQSNPSSRELYDATASQLVKSGLSTPAGEAAFREWIGRDDPKQPGRVPGRWVRGWEMKSVERRWLLLMARSSFESEGGIRLRNMTDSLKAYNAIMTEGFSDGATIASLARDNKRGAYTLAKVSDRLNGLRFHANPLVVPLLDQTILLLAKASKLSEKKITQQEKMLAVLRDAIWKQSESIDSYLNWYEAAKLPVHSGMFERFLHTPGSVIRKGPLGRYLDALEARGW